MTLKKGWNVLLVKFADDTDRQGVFRLRLTNAADSVAKRFVADPKQAPPFPAVTETADPPAPTVALAEILRSRSVAAPNDLEARRALGVALRQCGDYEGAILALKEAVALAPNSGLLHSELAKALQANDQTTEAVAERETARKRDKRLVTPTDKTALFAKLPTTKTAPGVSEVRVLDEGIVVVYPDYAQAHYTHEVVTVLDDAAVKRYQQYHISLPSQTASATLETARLIKADGKIVDARGDSNEEFAAFPSLAIGDTIDIVYRVEDYPRRGLAGKFWTEWYFSQRTGPVKLSRLVLIAPKTMEMGIHTSGAIGEPTIQDKGEWRIREWRVANLPSDKLELLAPPFRDTGMWVDISTVKSWKDIVEWYESLSAPRCLPDAVVRAKADELTAGLTTDEEKTKAIVPFCRRQDSVPDDAVPPERVCSYRRKGDTA